MTDRIRFLMSIDKEDMDKIVTAVKAINATKSRPSSMTNRQAVIRGLVKFALDCPISFISTWSKYVSVDLTKGSMISN